MSRHRPSGRHSTAAIAYDWVTAACLLAVLVLVLVAVLVW